MTQLAGASLVAKEDTVAVIIDDALGFTDADRLAKMGAVLDTVGGDGQVIVLTCSPHRYHSAMAVDVARRADQPAVPTRANLLYRVSICCVYATRECQFGLWTR